MTLDLHVNRPNGDSQAYSVHFSNRGPCPFPLAGRHRPRCRHPVHKGQQSVGQEQQEDPLHLPEHLVSALSLVYITCMPCVNMLAEEKSKPYIHCTALA